RPSGEVGAQPAGLEYTFNTAALLTLKFEGEDIARADDLAFHAADLADALDPTNPIAHALDLHEDIDGTRDLRAQRSQRQVGRRHQDHVFEPEQRIAGRVRVDRR